MPNHNKRLHIHLLLIIAAVLMAGCQPAVYMMPTPVAIQTGDLDPFADTPEEARNSDIIVGYATNRQPFGVKDARFYTRQFDEDLRIGEATVQIGDGEESWEEIRSLSQAGAFDSPPLLSLSNVKEMATLHSDDPLSSLTPEMAQMMQELNEVIEKSPQNDITVYVHGANNNFYRTVAQAAQYRHFTGRQAVVLLYSWPSAESLVRYGTDIRNIRQTVQSFARFIRLLAMHTNARNINILAYSAGATLVTESLALIGADISIPDRKAYKDSLRLGVVYFAAPDTDFDDFVEQFHNYYDLIDSITVTINPHDSVLAIAQEARLYIAYGGKEEDIAGATTKSRLGRPNVDDISEEDRQWLIELSNIGKIDIIDIDPRKIPGLSKGSHDFWYSNPWVSTDALLELDLRISPAERGLVGRSLKGGGRVWSFPPDYEQRVSEALTRLAEEYARQNDQSK